VTFFDRGSYQTLLQDPNNQKVKKKKKKKKEKKKKKRVRETLMLIGQHTACAHFRGKPRFQSNGLAGKL